jgi:hypothetical protein
MDELKTKILEICNSSGLPLECIMYVLKDVWRDAEAALREAKAKFPANEEKKEEK